MFVVVSGMYLGPSHRQTAGTHPQWSQAVDHVVGMATTTHVRLTNFIAHGTSIQKIITEYSTLSTEIRNAVG